MGLSPLKVDLVALALDDEVRLQLDKVACRDQVVAVRSRPDAVDLAADEGPERAERGLDDRTPLDVRVRDGERVRFGGSSCRRFRPRRDGPGAVGFERVAVVRRQRARTGPFRSGFGGEFRGRVRLFEVEAVLHGDTPLSLVPSPSTGICVRRERERGGGGRTSMSMAFMSHPSALLPLATFSASYTASKSFVSMPRQVMSFVLARRVSAPVAALSLLAHTSSLGREEFLVSCGACLCGRGEDEEPELRFEQGIKSLVDGAVPRDLLVEPPVEVAAEFGFAVVRERGVLLVVV